MAMMNKERFPYFEIQAYMGTTKHMGGLESTKELIELCQIRADQTVLDVGCGVGATAVYLAKKHGCRVVGVDISEQMVARAEERSKREGLQNRVSFRIASAIALPFESEHFDAVICESVITFIVEKGKALCEYARVAKPGGFVGLNEETLIKTPLSEDLVEFVRRTWEIEDEIPTAEVWTGLMTDCGLTDIQAKPRRFSAVKESSQVRRYRLEDLVRMTSRSLQLYLTNPDFREYMKSRRSLPKNLFDYLGYGLYVGRK
jgi:arsenite methyltransferase